MKVIKRRRLLFLEFLMGITLTFTPYGLAHANNGSDNGNGSDHNDPDRTVHDSPQPNCNNVLTFTGRASSRPAPGQADATNLATPLNSQIIDFRAARNSLRRENNPTPPSPPEEDHNGDIALSLTQQRAQQVLFTYRSSQSDFWELFSEKELNARVQFFNGESSLPRAHVRDRIDARRIPTLIMGQKITPPVQYRIEENNHLYAYAIQDKKLRKLMLTTSGWAHTVTPTQDAEKLVHLTSLTQQIRGLRVSRGKGDSWILHSSCLTAGNLCKETLSYFSPLNPLPHNIEIENVREFDVIGDGRRFDLVAVTDHNIFLAKASQGDEGEFFRLPIAGLGDAREVINLRISPNERTISILFRGADPENPYVMIEIPNNVISRTPRSPRSP